MSLLTELEKLKSPRAFSINILLLTELAGNPLFYFSSEMEAVLEMTETEFHRTHAYLFQDPDLQHSVKPVTQTSDSTTGRD